MSGPQNFQELHQGLRKRKEKIHQRNIQIKDLIHRNAALESKLDIAREAGNELFKTVEAWKEDEGDRFPGLQIVLDKWKDALARIGV